MKLTSLVIENKRSIPSEYTCDGENINPPLEISEIPSGAESLALLVHDPDAVSGDFVHWLVWNIDSATREIEEGSIPPGAVQGVTSFGHQAYGGPCPPSGEHRYFFHLYALDKKLDLSSDAGREEFMSEIDGHILDETELVGLYSRR